MLNGRHLKRPSASKRKKREESTHTHQRLCELEWQHTLLSTEIQTLREIRNELEDSRNSFAALYEQAPIGYVTLDLTGHIHDLNPAVTALLGFPSQKLRGLPFSFLVYREDMRRFLEHLLRCNKLSEKRLVTELRLQGSDKTLVPVQLISVAFEVAGQKMLLTALVDLTERQQNERALAQAKEFAEAIVETVREPLIVLDAELKIISVNHAFVELFKTSEQWARGQSIETLLNMWWTGNELRGELEKVLIKNQPLENYSVEVKPHGIGARTLRLNARRLYQKTVQPGFILLAVEDVTDQEHARLQLRQINEELEKRVAARTEALQKSDQQMESFCYSIAHDLRAPLRSMKSFSDLLIEEFGKQIGEEGRDFTRRIQQSAERMDLLIRDLLNYGQLNTINLPLQNIDLDHVLKEVLLLQEQEIAEKHALVKVQPHLPKVLGHPVVLQVVLTNLISNALKFIKPGATPEISIGVDEEEDQHVRVWVQDNGIGIPAAHQKVIFGVFQKLHSYDSYPGTGIGLALVKKGVERIGGRVGVESAPDKGSRFWIELMKPDILKLLNPV